MGGGGLGTAAVAGGSGGVGIGALGGLKQTTGIASTLAPQSTQTGGGLAALGKRTNAPTLPSYTAATGTISSTKEGGGGGGGERYTFKKLEELINKVHL